MIFHAHPQKLMTWERGIVRQCYTGYTFYEIFFRPLGLANDFLTGFFSLCVHVLLLAAVS